MDPLRIALICMMTSILTYPASCSIIRSSKPLHKRQISGLLDTSQIGNPFFGTLGTQNTAFRPISGQSPALFSGGARIGPSRHTFSTIDNPVGVRVPQPVPVQILRAVPVPVRVGVPVDVPRAVRVIVPQAVGVPVPRPFPVDVPRAVGVRVPQAVPVAITQAVGVPIPQPVPILNASVNLNGNSLIDVLSGRGIGSGFQGQGLAIEQLSAINTEQDGQINSFLPTFDDIRGGQSGIISDLLPPRQERPQGIGFSIGQAILNRQRFNLADLQ